MNYKILFIALLISCCFASCQKGPQGEIPFRGYITVPAGINTFLTHHFPITNIPGAPFENIIEAQPAYVRLYVEDGEFSTDFIREAFFEATTDSTRNEMAYRQDIPITNSRYLELYPSIFDMKDHISQDKFQMTLKLNLRSIPVTATTIRVEFAVLATYGD
jgi:hypothetical protein